MSISVIARELGIDRKTVSRTIAGGLEPPVYGPRKPRPRRIDPFVPYLRESSRIYRNGRSIYTPGCVAAHLVPLAYQLERRVSH